MTRALDVDAAGELSAASLSEEEVHDILAEVYPQLCNDVAMLVGKPFRLIWDPRNPTASTDCQAEVRIAPHFFLEGRTEVGFGVTYHEGGHILFSPWGVKLLERARKEGGETLEHIMGIILDRKDDLLNVRYAPGFAERLRNRLAYICTMTRRETLAVMLKGKSEKDVMALVRKLPPRDVYEDFFWAAKWHRSPRFRATHKAMRYVRFNRLVAASPDKLLWIAKKVREILGKDIVQPAVRQRAERKLVVLVLLGASIEKNRGRALNKSVLRALSKLAILYIGSVRAAGLRRLESALKKLGVTFPGPVSVGTVAAVPIKPVPASPKYSAEYQRILGEVRDFVQPLTQKLRLLDNPAEFTVFGQDEGELDLSASAYIATGLGGYHQETVTERDIDAEIHLALDCSGSMAAGKIAAAKKIMTVFNEAILQMAPSVAGRLWSFNSEEICDFGPVSRQSGFVEAKAVASNSDTHLLCHVGKELGKSHRRRKVLILLCDDGPDNLQKAAEISRQLMARGIIVIHLLVGVHGTPEVYPIELLYASMQECLEEFGGLLMTIMKHLR